ncbi:hypothetical protein LUZ61_011535 [Rhynchospora tenuis]|uniref:Zinc finger PHD-type domain-containing protein n=1 Tax=Rhynchospora tenuis TaxID=198213 RepID=A0AAD6F0J0_9POAL|nr:hypothetical protein LUZ61_011535 [Rhynchospora tenuis]
MTAYGKDDRAFDWVCALCDNGGDILSCRGRCLRSFHPTPDPTLDCETLNLTVAQVKEMRTFLCDNCLSEKHQCYACGILGSSAEINREVHKCGFSDCGLHYHPNCVAKLLHCKDEVKVAQLVEKIKEGVMFKCPRHLCHICRGRENKNIRELQFAICRRCPISYHRRCLPREIIFEYEDEDNLQRAWDDLLPDRILIYCMKHKIEKDLGTPLRNHLQFPPVDRSTLTANQGNRFRLVDVSKSNHLSPAKKKQRIPERGLQTGGSKLLAFGERQKVSKIASTAEARPPRSSCPHISKRLVLQSVCTAEARLPSSFPRIRVKQVLNSSSAAEAKIPRSSFPHISEATENNMRALLEEQSSSVTIDMVRMRLKIPSTHHTSHWGINESISEKEVIEAVESANAALGNLQTLDGNIEEAKAICSPETIFKINNWRTKLNVYLAPFIHGSRYTSFGRHFTKVDKLKEIVDRLHWYVQDGDMVVDFCCGSNDFSILMSDKLKSAGKKCLFKNFDLQQPKNDFSFETRDWMTVEPKELLDGERLIMGLNPPFGVKARLANKFINKALEFKPKILILIVPKETERLDKRHEYDLVWHDPCLLSGKSFYLPGSVDDEHSQMEQWNNRPPPLYLWSRRDWAPLHREIANKHGHHFGENILPYEELDFKTKAVPNQLYNCSSEEDKENTDVCKKNQGLLVKEGEITVLPPLSPLAIPPVMETGGQINNNEHDICDDSGFLSDMSISPDAKRCSRGQDDGFIAGLETGPSAAWCNNFMPEVGPLNPVGCWALPGFEGWWDEGHPPLK